MLNFMKYGRIIRHWRVEALRNNCNFSLFPYLDHITYDKMLKNEKKRENQRRKLNYFRRVVKCCALIWLVIKKGHKNIFFPTFPPKSRRQSRCQKMRPNCVSCGLLTDAKSGVKVGPNVT